MGLIRWCDHLPAFTICFGRRDAVYLESYSSLKGGSSLLWAEAVYRKAQLRSHSPARTQQSGAAQTLQRQLLQAQSSLVL